MRRPLVLLLCAAACAHHAGEGAPVTPGAPEPAAEAGPALGVDLTTLEARAPPVAPVATPAGSAPAGASTPSTRPAASTGRPAAPVTTAVAPARPAQAAAVAPARPAPAAAAPVTVPDVAGADLAAPEFATALGSAPRPATGDGARARLVGNARQLVGQRFKGDCTGFVRTVLAKAQVSLPALHPSRTMTESLYRSMPHVKLPQPGDLAFFHATRSRDRTGTPESRFSHVALVEKVDGSRVTLIHRGSRGIRRFVMNLEKPHDRHENDMVRRRRAKDAPGTRYLAAELFGGYATTVGRKAPAADRAGRVAELGGARRPSLSRP